MSSDTVELNAISRIGVGCYRMTQGVEGHHTALRLALERGCTLIDTASNYGDGGSEELVGDVLKSNSQGKVFVITKAGYITASAAARLQAAGIPREKLHPISPESMYSISPDVLRLQADESRRRLGQPVLDALLLHNPEHYFNCEELPRSQEGFDEAIRNAFNFLEEYVAEGKLRYYGISSNTLASTSPQGNRIHLERLLSIAEDISRSHHFRFVEFPLNMIETEALLPQVNGRSLIDQIRASGLISIANRPLNGQRGNQTIRLATYEDEGRGLTPELAGADYEQVVDLIAARLRSAELPHKVMDFAVMQFLRDNWHGIEHPDTVDLIFKRHFYPFVEQLWEESPPHDARAAFRRRHSKARQFSRQKLTAQAQQLRKDLIEAGTITSDDNRSLAVIACDFCLKAGVDHVVVGMRTPKYVQDLSELIN